MSPIPFVPLLALILLLKKAADFVKAVTSRDINGAATQIFAWAAGIGLVWLFAQADVANGVDIGGQSLAVLDGWSLTLLGLFVGSGGSVIHDSLRSLDNSTAPRYNRLLPPT